MYNSRIALKTYILLCAIGATLGSSANGQELPSAFNGTNLTGWQVPENNVWWKVEEGSLTATSDPERVGSNLWTEREYANFIFECEFRFGDGVVDSGVFLRDSKEQIQIGISGSLKRDLTASPYIDGKGYSVEAQGIEKLLQPDDWNTLTIVAKGKNYAVWLNNQHVLNYDSETAVEEGPIGLQLHPGNEMSISFRNIRIAELD
ncbi:3-keto-disaccharide hydrolase [Bythopirellula polymerisocia]|uniref:3-keto-alpha-glucoside-1,2-lyase/3-keto-2-hydroxy-glucal hydratase domain-containing protein n=1 Tax=Bythopirellula polymerisocia TaxID=2528003 RepID=A0A5C6CVM5_9BACT|nr:DUF1080 domain-containing protein [Bythopirellula polymerisocia]TWU27724.1 hypothetical protein Pla144_25010 [Bythopirellula polymerisocia]